MARRIKLELKKAGEGDTGLVLLSIAALLIAIFVLVWGWEFLK